MSDSTISLSPSSYSFGVRLKDSTTSTTLRITNDSVDATLILGTVGSPTIPFYSSGTWISDSTIDPSAYVDATVIYIPNALSTGSSCAIAIPSNDPNDATVTWVVDGTCQQAITYMTPALKAFGNVANLSIVDQTVSVVNLGNVDMTVGTLSGLAAPYSMVNDGITGQTIAADATKTVVVRYNPTARGATTDTLIIPTSDTTENFVASGTSTAAIVITPSSKDFGNKANLSTTDQTVSVVNHANVDMTCGNMTGITSPFTLVNNNVTGATIGAGATKTFVARFAPTTYARYDSTVTIPNNDTTQTFILNGLSQEADISVSPTGKSFGSKLWRHVTEYFDATVTNIGNITLRMQDITVPTINSFWVTGDTVSNAKIQPGGTATVRIHCTPAALGDLSSAVIFNSNDPDTASYHLDMTAVGQGDNMEGQRPLYPRGLLYSVTLSDTTEAVFADEYGITGYCNGFQTGVDGTMTVVGADANSTTSNLYCIKGEYYPYSIRLFKSTGTAPLMTVVATR